MGETLETSGVKLQNQLAPLDPTRKDIPSGPSTESGLYQAQQSSTVIPEESFGAPTPLPFPGPQFSQITPTQAKVFSQAIANNLRANMRASARDLDAMGLPAAQGRVEMVKVRPPSIHQMLQGMAYGPGTGLVDYEERPVFIREGETREEAAERASKLWAKEDWDYTKYAMTRGGDIFLSMGLQHPAWRSFQQEYEQEYPDMAGWVNANMVAAHVVAFPVTIQGGIWHGITKTSVPLLRRGLMRMFSSRPGTTLLSSQTGRTAFGDWWVQHFGGAGVTRISPRLWSEVTNAVQGTGGYFLPSGAVYIPQGISQQVYQRALSALRLLKARTGSEIPIRVVRRLVDPSQIGAAGTPGLVRGSFGPQAIGTLDDIMGQWGTHLTNLGGQALGATAGIGARPSLGALMAQSPEEAAAYLEELKKAPGQAATLVGAFAGGGALLRGLGKDLMRRPGVPKPPAPPNELMPYNPPVRPGPSMPPINLRNVYTPPVEVSPTSPLAQEFNPRLHNLSNQILQFARNSRSQEVAYATLQGLDKIRALPMPPDPQSHALYAQNVEANLRTLRDLAGADKDQLAQVLGYDVDALIGGPEPSLPLLDLARWGEGVRQAALDTGLDVNEALLDGPPGGDPATSALRIQHLADKIHAVNPQAQVGPPAELLSADDFIRQAGKESTRLPVKLPGATFKPLEVPELARAPGKEAFRLDSYTAGRINQQLVYDRTIGEPRILGHLIPSKETALGEMDLELFPIWADNQGRMMLMTGDPNRMGSVLEVDVTKDLLFGEGAPTGLPEGRYTFEPSVTSPVALRLEEGRLMIDPEATEERKVWTDAIKQRSVEAARKGRPSSADDLGAYMESLVLFPPKNLRELKTAISNLDRFYNQIDQVGQDFDRIAEMEALPGAEDFQIARERAKLVWEQAFYKSMILSAKSDLVFTAGRPSGLEPRRAPYEPPAITGTRPLPPAFYSPTIRLLEQVPDKKWRQMGLHKEKGLRAFLESRTQPGLWEGLKWSVHDPMPKARQISNSLTRPYTERYTQALRYVAQVAKRELGEGIYYDDFTLWLATARRIGAEGFDEALERDYPKISSALGNHPYYRSEISSAKELEKTLAPASALLDKEAEGLNVKQLIRGINLPAGQAWTKEQVLSALAEKQVKVDVKVLPEESRPDPQVRERLKLELQRASSAFQQGYNSLEDLIRPTYESTFKRVDEFGNKESDEQLEALFADGLYRILPNLDRRAKFPTEMAKQLFLDSVEEAKRLHKGVEKAEEELRQQYEAASYYDEETHYPSYTVPGTDLDNYHEFFFSLPELPHQLAKDHAEGSPPNTFARARGDVLDLPGRGRVLRVQELQPHTALGAGAGERRGGRPLPWVEARTHKLKVVQAGTNPPALPGGEPTPVFRVEDQDGRIVVKQLFHTREEAESALQEEVARIEEAPIGQDVLTTRKDKTREAHPFQDNWVEVSLRHLARWAAEQGLDGLALIGPGEASTYPSGLSALRTKANRIDWIRTPEGLTIKLMKVPNPGFHLVDGFHPGVGGYGSLERSHQEILQERATSYEHLAELLGGDMKLAERVVGEAAGATDDEQGSLSVDDIGGTKPWAVTIYGRKGPAAMQKVAKELGVQSGKYEHKSDVANEFQGFLAWMRQEQAAGDLPESEIRLIWEEPGNSYRNEYQTTQARNLDLARQPMTYTHLPLTTKAREKLLFEGQPLRGKGFETEIPKHQDYLRRLRRFAGSTTPWLVFDPKHETSIEAAFATHQEARDLANKLNYEYEDAATLLEGTGRYNAPEIIGTRKMFMLGSEPGFTGNEKADLEALRAQIREATGDYRAALEHLASGKGFSKKPKLFAALKPRDRFNYLLSRIQAGEIKHRKHLDALNPNEWRKSGFPKYFGTWKPSEGEMRRLGGAWKTRAKEWATAERVRETLKSDEERITNKLSIEELTTIPVNEIAELSPKQQLAWAKAFLGISEDTPAISNMEASKYEALTAAASNIFGNLALEGDYPTGYTPDNVLERMALSAKSAMTSIRSLTTLTHRPFRAVGPAKQWPTAAEAAQAIASGAWKNEPFEIIWEGAQKYNEFVLDSYNDFRLLLEGASRNEELDRRIFTVLDNLEADKLLSQPEWTQEFRVGPFKRKVNLQEWIPKLRKRFEEVISKVEAAKVGDLTDQLVHNKSDLYEFMSERNNRLIPYAEEALGRPIEKLDDISAPEMEDLLKKLRKDNEMGNPIPLPGVYVSGKPAPFLGHLKFKTLENKIRSVEKKVEDLELDIKDIEGGGLRVKDPETGERKGYATYIYNLLWDDVKQLLEDANNSFSRSLNAETRETFLQARKGDDPLKTWAKTWFMYIPVMAKLMHLEPAIRRVKNSQAWTTMPSEYRTYFNQWFAALRGRPGYHDRILNQNYRNRMMQETGIDRLMGWGDKKRKEMEQGGKISRRGMEDIQRNIMGTLYLALLDPIKVSAMTGTEHGFISQELAKRPTSAPLQLAQYALWDVPKATGAGMRELASWVKSMGGGSRWFSDPTRFGVTNIVHDNLKAQSSYMEKALDPKLNRAISVASRIYFGILRAAEYHVRASTFYNRRSDALRQGMPREEANHWAAQVTNALIPAYDAREKSPFLRGFPGNFYMAFKNWLLGKMEWAGTSLQGTKTLLGGGPSDFTQATGEGAKELGIGPPRRTPELPEGLEERFRLTGDQLKRLQTLNEPMPPHGDMAPMPMNAAKKWNWAALLGIPSSIVLVAMIGRIMAELLGDYFNPFDTPKRLNPYDFTGFDQVPTAYWMPALSNFLTYSVKDKALVGLSVEEAHMLDRAKADLTYGLPLLGLVLRSRDRDQANALSLLTALSGGGAPGTPSPLDTRTDLLEDEYRGMGPTGRTWALRKQFPATKGPLSPYWDRYKQWARDNMIPVREQIQSMEDLVRAVLGQDEEEVPPPASDTSYPSDTAPGMQQWRAPAPSE
jgi:hypothetical protein